MTTHTTHSGALVVTLLALRVALPGLAAEPQIPTERCSGVAERVYWQYYDPDVVARSYACVDHLGCSATMIGPNILLAAAHCNNRTSITFRMYTAISGSCGGSSAGTQTTETFGCTYLLHTFPDTDMKLYFVRPNAAGESPGDTYGYIDPDIVLDSAGMLAYSASRARLSSGADVYSVWTNPLNDIGGQHLLFSKGQINDSTTDGWFTPNFADGTPNFFCTNARWSGGSQGGLSCDVCAVACNPNDCATCGAPSNPCCVPIPNRQIAVNSNTWSNPGASGSSQISGASHRLLLGPLSTGPTDARGRNQMGIADYLYWGWTDPNQTCLACLQTPPNNANHNDQVNQTFISSTFGLIPTQYYGFVDNDLNGIFDVQEDVELLRGENARDWYWLGFESLRRNALWIKEAAEVTFDTSDPITGVAYMSTVGEPGEGYVPALAHERLNLANGTYRISFTTYLSERASRDPIRVCFEGSVNECEHFDPSLSAWNTNVASFSASSNATLRFYLKPDTRLSMAAVSLVKDGASMDFDTYDKRYMWRNQNTGGRGLIWPNGRSASATNADWAGVVRRDPSRPLNDDWPLRNQQLAFEGGFEYRVCFDHKRAGRDPLSFGSPGAVRMVNQFGEITNSRALFSTSASWTGACTTWFLVPTDANNVQFGIIAFDASANGAYLVDNIVAERRPGTLHVDWRNAGLEDGTVDHPYNTVQEGVRAIGSGGGVVIASGSYAERFTIDKATTLTATGGLVIVGD